VILSAASCDKRDIRLDNPNDKLRPFAEFMQNNYAYSLFHAAIEKAGLTEELNGPGPFTVWAPTNEAFNRLGINRPEDFEAFGVDSVRQLVLYHVLRGRALEIEDIPENSANNRYTTESGADVWLARFDTGNRLTRMFRPYINGIMIGQWSNRVNSNEHYGRHNIHVANGILHEIGNVLRYDNVPVRDWLENHEDYQVLVAGLKHFGYWELLADDKQWTIVAPVDSLFEQEGMTVETVSALDTSVYGKRLFGAYIFPVRFFMSDLRLYLFAMRVTSTRTVDLRIYTPIIGDENFSNGILNNYSTFFVNRTFPSSGYGWDDDTYSTPNNAFDRDQSHLVRNGIIHRLDGVALLPGQVFND